MIKFKLTILCVILIIGPISLAVIGVGVSLSQSNCVIEVSKTHNVIETKELCK